MSGGGRDRSRRIVAREGRSDQRMPAGGSDRRWLGVVLTTASAVAYSTAGYFPA